MNTILHCGGYTATKSSGFRFITVLLAGILLFLMSVVSLSSCSNNGSTFSLPVRSLPDDAAEKQYSTFTYKEYDDGAVILISYDGSDSTLTVPDTIESKPVVALADGLFSGNPLLKSVRLGDNIETVGDGCFSGCTALYEISGGNKLWSSGISAFAGTPWFDSRTDEFVVIGDGLLIRYNGSDTSVAVPDSVRHICGAFENSAIVSVTMGDSVLTVGCAAFAGCHSLASVTFGKNTQFIGVSAFESCTSLASVKLPDNVEIISDRAFALCSNFCDVILSQSLTSIGEYSFYNCIRMKCLYIPAGLKRIGEYAFGDCYALSMVFCGGDESDYSGIPRFASNSVFTDVYKVYNASSPSGFRN